MTLGNLLKREFYCVFVSSGSLIKEETLAHCFPVLECKRGWQFAFIPPERSLTFFWKQFALSPFILRHVFFKVAGVPKII